MTCPSRTDLDLQGFCFDRETVRKDGNRSLTTACWDCHYKRLKCGINPADQRPKIQRIKQRRSKGKALSPIKEESSNIGSPKQKKGKRSADVGDDTDQEKDRSAKKQRVEQGIVRGSPASNTRDAGKAPVRTSEGAATKSLSGESDPRGTAVAVVAPGKYHASATSAFIPNPVASDNENHAAHVDFVEKKMEQLDEHNASLRETQALAIEECNTYLARIQSLTAHLQSQNTRIENQNAELQSLRAEVRGLRLSSSALEKSITSPHGMKPGIGGVAEHHTLNKRVATHNNSVSGSSSGSISTPISQPPVPASDTPAPGFQPPPTTSETNPLNSEVIAPTPEASALASRAKGSEQTFTGGVCNPMDNQDDLASPGAGPSSSGDNDAAAAALAKPGGEQEDLATAGAGPSSNGWRVDEEDVEMGESSAAQVSAML